MMNFELPSGQTVQRPWDSGEALSRPKLFLRNEAVFAVKSRPLFGLLEFFVFMRVFWGRRSLVEPFPARSVALDGAAQPVQRLQVVERVQCFFAEIVNYLWRRDVIGVRSQLYGHTRDR